MGIQVWGEDEAGPYQVTPQSGPSWQPEPGPAGQPHADVRGGTAKLPTLFRPATVEVPSRPTTRATNAELHAWVQHEIATVIDAFPPVFSAPENAPRNMGPEGRLVRRGGGHLRFAFCALLSRRGRMKNSIGLILLAVALGVAGQLTLKLGMDQVGRLGAEALAQPLHSALRVVTNPLVIVGLGLYVLGAAVWLPVLSRVPLSLAYPVLALSYAFTPALAWLVLGESVPGLRWAGIATICAGVFLVSRS